MSHSNLFAAAFRLILLVSFVLAIHLHGVGVSAAEPRKSVAVLNAEAAGDPVNRREALASESDRVSQWQSGRVQLGDQWVDMESLQQSSLTPQLAAYRKARDSQAMGAEGHRQMAHWCEAQGLTQMAQNHWKALVTIAIDDGEARKALGHKRVGNHWFSSEEFKRAANEQKQDAEQLKQWLPKLRKITSKIESPKSQIKLEGLDELERINDVGAVTALKQSVFMVEPTTSLPLVSKIRAIRSKPSCLALCEIAVLAPNSDAGRLAIAGLKEYDEHFYVPELLQMLELPTELRQNIEYLENGSFVVRRAYLRETMTQKEQTDVLKLITKTFDQPMFGFMENQAFQIPEIKNFVDSHIQCTFYWTEYYPASSASLARLANIELREADRKLKLLNNYKAQRDQNVKTVLAAISNLPPNEPPESYWNWWPNFNENFTSSEKPTTYTQETDDSSYAPIVRYEMSVDKEIRSCLIAGTPIQTAEGLRPIEDIKVGDIVASLNVESGETALRPVTYISNRMADTTFLFTTSSGETIRATGGHYWWVIGKGWLRSRELSAGQFMRTGNASVEITKIEKIDDPIKVYNLIIDDSHTYFVGKDRLLSWDLSALQPTLQTAPGQFNRSYTTTR